MRMYRTVHAGPNTQPRRVPRSPVELVVPVAKAGRARHTAQCCDRKDERQRDAEEHCRAGASCGDEVVGPMSPEVREIVWAQLARPSLGAGRAP